MPKSSTIQANGTVRLLVMIISVGAMMITSLAAVVRPINARIDQLQENIELLREETVRHHTERAHPDARSDLATLSERFTEVETQFRNLREIVELYQAWNGARLDKLETGRERPATAPSSP